MALRTYRPTSPGLRQLVLVDRGGLYKGAPVKMLTEGKSKTGGRNSFGLAWADLSAGRLLVCEVADESTLEAELARLEPAEVLCPDEDGWPPCVTGRTGARRRAPWLFDVDSGRRQLLRFFDVIYITTGGGPGNASTTLNILAYRRGFEFFEFGYAAAIMVTLSAMVFGTVLAFARLRRSVAW